MPLPTFKFPGEEFQYLTEITMYSPRDVQNIFLKFVHVLVYSKYIFRYRDNSIRFRQSALLYYKFDLQMESSMKAKLSDFALVMMVLMSLAASLGQFHHHDCMGHGHITTALYSDCASCRANHPFIHSAHTHGHDARHGHTSHNCALHLNKALPNRTDTGKSDTSVRSIQLFTLPPGYADSECQAVKINIFDSWDSLLPSNNLICTQPFRGSPYMV